MSRNQIFAGLLIVLCLFPGCSPGFMKDGKIRAIGAQVKKTIEEPLLAMENIPGFSDAYSCSDFISWALFTHPSTGRNETIAIPGYEARRPIFQVEEAIALKLEIYPEFKKKIGRPVTEALPMFDKALHVQLFEAGLAVLEVSSGETWTAFHESRHFPPLPGIPDDMSVVFGFGATHAERGRTTIRIFADGLASKEETSGGYGPDESVKLEVYELTAEDLHAIIQAFKDNRFFDLEEQSSDQRVSDGYSEFVFLNMNGRYHTVSVINTSRPELDRITQTIRGILKTRSGRNQISRKTVMNASQEEILFKLETFGEVNNLPTHPTTFSINAPAFITKIRTYHWNFGRGSTPGTISLLDQHGMYYGPWTASGEQGMGRIQNAYWMVQPNMDLPAGTYTILDSDQSTWSQNNETNGRGIAFVYGKKSAL